MTSLGLLQYLAPVLQFALGLLCFGEDMPAGRWIGFVLVWLALSIFTCELIAPSAPPSWLVCRRAPSCGVTRGGAVT